LQSINPRSATQAGKLLVCRDVIHDTRGCNDSLRHSICGFALLSWQQSEGMRVKMRNWMTSA